MKLLVDSNLSLSLSSRTAERRPALFLVGVEGVGGEGVCETLAAFRNLECLGDRSNKSQVTGELNSIRSKLAGSEEVGSVLQTFESGRDDLRWYVQRDAAGRLITMLACVQTDSRQVIKFIEKVKTAVIHYNRSPEKLQEKVAAMAGMFNETFCDANSTQPTISGKMLSDKSEAKTVREHSVVSECPNVTVVVGKEAVVAAPEAKTPAGKATGHPLKLSPKLVAAIAFGLLLLWIFYNKFFRARHRRH